MQANGAANRHALSRAEWPQFRFHDFQALVSAENDAIYLVPIVFSHHLRRAGCGSERG